ncbi:MAG: RNA 2',3'-cyclic phosphodiesterase [Halothiobacillaceae bacterium]
MPGSEDRALGGRGRFFFALWPGAGQRRALARAATGLPETGRAVPPANYHLTLAFLGDLDRRALDALCRAGEGVPATGGALWLTRFGGFEAARVLFAAPARCPRWLAERQALLLDRLASVGYAPQEQHAGFRPHVTLRRRVNLPWPELPPAIDPAVDWQGSALALLESPLTSGTPGYRVVWHGGRSVG